MRLRLSLLVPTATAHRTCTVPKSRTIYLVLFCTAQSIFPTRSSNARLAYEIWNSSPRKSYPTQYAEDLRPMRVAPATLPGTLPCVAPGFPAPASSVASPKRLHPYVYRVLQVS